MRATISRGVSAAEAGAASSLTTVKTEMEAAEVRTWTILCQNEDLCNIKWARFIVGFIVVYKYILIALFICVGGRDRDSRDDRGGRDRDSRRDDRDR